MRWASSATSCSPDVRRPIGVRPRASPAPAPRGSICHRDGLLAAEQSTSFARDREVPQSGLRRGSCRRLRDARTQARVRRTARALAASTSSRHRARRSSSRNRPSAEGRSPASPADLRLPAAPSPAETPRSRALDAPGDRRSVRWWIGFADAHPLTPRCLTCRRGGPLGPEQPHGSRSGVLPALPAARCATCVGPIHLLAMSGKQRSAANPAARADLEQRPARLDRLRPFRVGGVVGGTLIHRLSAIANERSPNGRAAPGSEMIASGE